MGKLCLLRFHYSLDIFYRLIVCYNCVDDGLYSLILIVGPCTIFPNSIGSSFTPMSILLKAPNMGSLEFSYALNITKNHSTPLIMFLKTFKHVTNGSLPVFLSLTSNTIIRNNYKQTINP